MKQATLLALQEARRAEREQALFYHALAAHAEEAGDNSALEDLSGMHADEQHHLSRLSVRLLELDQTLADISDVRAPAVTYPEWQPLARAREQRELEQYRSLASLDLDAPTAALIAEIIDVEQQHAQFLGGKFMSA